MKYDIIPFHNNYGINKKGVVINFATNTELSPIMINNHKCVYIDKIPYKIMELLIKTYITLYDNFIWDYYDMNHNNCTLDNVWIKIPKITVNIDMSLEIYDNQYLEIKDHPGYYISNNGTVFSSKSGIFMKKKYDVGYPVISFPKANRLSDIFKIHRLVYCTWNNLDYKSVEVVHHKDSNKYNSWLWNLDSATMFTNTRYAILDGQKPVQFSFSEIEQMCILYKEKYSFREISEKLFGTDDKYSDIRNMIYRIKRGMAYKDLMEKYELNKEEIPSKNVLSESDVHNICKMIERNKSCNSIAKLYGVTSSTILNIKNHKRWTKISSQYNF